MKRRHRGGSKEQLKRWARKALELTKKHGPALARKHRLASRGLSHIASRYPKSRAYMRPLAMYAAQKGYGLTSAGGALRSVGGCRRRRRR